MRDHAHRSVFFYGYMEPEVTDTTTALVDARTVFLDVGANCGYYSLLARDLGAEEVHAFEPNPYARQLFDRSLAISGSRITLNSIACGAAPGRASLFLPDDSGNIGTATLVRDHAMSEDSIAVQVVTIDDYCDRHSLTPTLLKIDVEGFEASVLQGATRTLIRAQPIVICELRDSAARRLLTGLGYRERRLAQNEWYSDSVFLPRSSVPGEPTSGDDG